MSELEEDILATLRCIVNAILPVLQQAYSACYLVYRDTGMPYGDTFDGCMQWVREMLQRDGNEQEIERIRQLYEAIRGIQKVEEEVTHG